MRGGVAAASAYRTATKNAGASKPVSEPESSRPTVKMGNQSRILNKIADGYVAKANIGSSESPQHVIINLPRSVANRVEMDEPGELRMMQDSYAITHSSSVPKVRRPTPSDKSEITELPADVGRIPDQPKSILAVYFNAGNATAGVGPARRSSTCLRVSTS